MNRLSENRRVRLVMTLWILVTITTSCAARPSPTPSSPSTTPTATPAEGDYWPTRGWRTSAPEAQGLDPLLLAQLPDVIQQKRLGIQSLLVIRHGTIVSETYFAGYNQGTTHELYSCTKSFISTLVGIAVDKGYLNNLSRPVLDFFPEQAGGDPDPRLAAMTVENLLTMTSGLAWEEGDPIYRAMYQSRNWVSFVLKTPIAEQPGTHFNYCSGCSHVLSAILQQATDMKTLDFAQKYLFTPLGIKSPRWDTDAQGIPIGGWGLQLTPRDMAKLGYLYLHQGNWEGKQIVSADWIEAATRKHVSTDNELGYGYQWWVYPRYGAYTALGRDGQTIFVVPDKDMIVVTTATSMNHDPIFEMIEKYILPAIRK